MNGSMCSYKNPEVGPLPHGQCKTLMHREWVSETPVLAPRVILSDQQNVPCSWTLSESGKLAGIMAIRISAETIGTLYLGAFTGSPFLSGVNINLATSNLQNI